MLMICRYCGSKECTSKSGITNKCNDCVSGFFKKETGQPCDAEMSEEPPIAFICNNCKIKMIEWAIKNKPKGIK